MKYKLMIATCILIVGVLGGYFLGLLTYEPWIPFTSDLMTSEVRSSYDYRETAAYRGLSKTDKDKLNAAHQDFVLIWGALDKYAYDHKGKVPRSLDELVPDYLHQLPKDPFTELAKDAIEKNREASSYIYRPGDPHNRAWILSSVGLPDFPYQRKDHQGLYVVRGDWISGRNLYLFIPKLYARR